MEFTVRRTGNGLHIMLPKRLGFKPGDTVTIATLGEGESSLSLSQIQEVEEIVERVVERIQKGG